MDKSPLRSKWAEFFLKMHKGLLIRRHILKDLYKLHLENTVLHPMIKYYFCCIFSSASLYYIFRKESLAIRFLFSASSFSLSFIYIQLFFEESVYYYKGIQDTEAGHIIRKYYIKHYQESWTIPMFKQRESQYKAFNAKYRLRKNPMEKFFPYAESLNFDLSSSLLAIQSPENNST